MTLPVPQLGLVISYSYLWHDERRRGRAEGAKDRPSVIVLKVDQADGGGSIVTVAPITHSPPDDPSAALELPPRVKAHLGLDSERSWVILDELNRFTWPGFDLRPTRSDPHRFDYGLLPPKLFAILVSRLREVWADRRVRLAGRD